uniref:Retrovirus-related Pol polyprotein LINE-1 n=1 Tax=Hirondellea gigas TaxID=1518452 RepID=A0A6A7FPU9_9CRUS
MDVKVKSMERRKRRSGVKRTKEWKLKDEVKRMEFEEIFQLRTETHGGGWEQMRSNVIEAARDVCGETTGKRRIERETWWWSEVVQQAIREEKKLFKVWQKMGRGTIEINIRREVARAKRVAWERWSEDLEGPEGKGKMFRIAKQMRKDRKDIVGAMFIKDEAGDIKVEERGIMERWKRYFEQLLNEENEYEIEEIDRTEGPIGNITEEEVRMALRGMKNNAPGPTGLTSGMLKKLGNIRVVELTTIFREVAEEVNIPEDWKRSVTIPIFKGKGDVLQCGKYRGMRLLEHGMKIFEKVLEERLIKIDGRQFGFRSGKSMTDAVFILRQIQEKFEQNKRKLYHMFVDLDKSFDWVLRGVRVGFGKAGSARKTDCTDYGPLCGDNLR